MSGNTGMLVLQSQAHQSSYPFFSSPSPCHLPKSVPAAFGVTYKSLQNLIYHPISSPTTSTPQTPQLKTQTSTHVPDSRRSQLALPRDQHTKQHSSPTQLPRTLPRKTRWLPTLTAAPWDRPRRPGCSPPSRGGRRRARSLLR